MLSGILTDSINVDNSVMQRNIGYCCARPRRDIVIKPLEYAHM